MYRTGVSRVQFKLTWKKARLNSFFSHPYGDQFKHKLLVYNHKEQKLSEFMDQRMQFDSRRIIQVCNDAYTFTWNRPVAVTKYTNPTSCEDLKVDQLEAL